MIAKSTSALDHTPTHDELMQNSAIFVEKTRVPRIHTETPAPFTKTRSKQNFRRGANKPRRALNGLIACYPRVDGEEGGNSIKKFSREWGFRCGSIRNGVSLFTCYWPSMLVCVREKLEEGEFEREVRVDSWEISVWLLLHSRGVWGIFIAEKNKCIGLMKNLLK